MKINIDRLMSRICNYDDFSEVITIARASAYGPLFLVGGKLYRTIVEMTHGYDCGAALADWDFLVLGSVKPPTLGNINNPYTHKNWVVKSLPSYQHGSWANFKANSVTLLKNGLVASLMSRRVPIRTTADKIDIIAIDDIAKGGGLSDYFKVVPLDIQQLALDIENTTPALLGAEALNAIDKRAIRINNAQGALPNLDISSYLADKAKSLNFTYEGQVVNQTACNCYPNDIKALFRWGCQFPKEHI